MNCPIGTNFDNNAPWNDTDEQVPEPEKCYYCGSKVHEFNRDNEGDIICLSCLHDKLKENPKFESQLLTPIK